MKATITLNNVSVQRDIPVSWDQVTFKQFLELEKCGNDIIRVIALFTGTEYETLLKSKVVGLNAIVSVLGFLQEKMIATVPKTILGYRVPENLEYEQVQMYLDLKNYTDEAAKLSPQEQLESYAMYCAVYACMAKHGKYDWKLAEEMKGEFLNAPCTEVVGIGLFTLGKLIALKTGIDQTSRKANSPFRRLKLVLAGWRIRTVLYLRSFNWRKRLV